MTTSLPKIVIIILVLVLLALAGSYIYVARSHPSAQNNVPQTSQDISELARDSGVNVFSVEGTITSLDKNILGFKTGHIKNGAQVSDDKTINTDGVILVQVQTGTNTKLAAGKLSDLKIGQKIAVYTEKYSYDQSQLEPFKIIILK